MSNTNRPAPQTDRPTPTDRPADRPAATFPTGPWTDRLEAHRERLNDLWADATPTEELPLFVRTNAPSRHEGAAPASGPHPQHEQAPSHPHPQPPLCQDMQTPLCQDMWRPRWLPSWHPSLMQLAIGAALVAALLGACNVAAIQAHRTARNHCHALVSSDWSRAERECRGTGAGTPVPEQLPSSPHTPSPTPSQAPSPSTGPAFTRVNSPSPSTQPSQASPAPDWVTQDTHAAYDRTDPHSSPLSLPRCTTAPDTPLPCRASLSSDGSRAVVLEEDSSLTALVRR